MQHVAVTVVLTSLYLKTSTFKTNMPLPVYNLQFFFLPPPHHSSSALTRTIELLCRFRLQHPRKFSGSAPILQRRTKNHKNST